MFIAHTLCALTWHLHGAIIKNWLFLSSYFRLDKLLSNLEISKEEPPASFLVHLNMKLAYLWLHKILQNLNYVLNEYQARAYFLLSSCWHNSWRSGAVPCIVPKAQQVFQKYLGVVKYLVITSRNNSVILSSSPE